MSSFITCPCPAVLAHLSSPTVPGSLPIVDEKIEAGQTYPEAAQAAADGTMQAFALPALGLESFSKLAYGFAQSPAPHCACCGHAKLFLSLVRTIILGQVVL